MTLPGILLAGITGFKYFGKGLSICMFIFAGFLPCTLNAFILYSMISPEVDFSIWGLPIIFNGYGMTALMAAVGFTLLIICKFRFSSMLSFILFVVRTFFGSALADFIFSWPTCHFQWKNVNNIASNLETLNNSNTLLATYGKVQTNALLVSFKTFYGYLGMLGILFMIFMRCIISEK